jgi:hypothetical protein
LACKSGPWNHKTDFESTFRVIKHLQTTTQKIETAGSNTEAKPVSGVTISVTTKEGPGQETQIIFRNTRTVVPDSDKQSFLLQMT